MFVPLPVPFVFQRSASDFSAWKLKSSLAPRSNPGKWLPHLQVSTTKPQKNQISCSLRGFHIRIYEKLTLKKINKLYVFILLTQFPLVEVSLAIHVFIYGIYLWFASHYWVLPWKTPEKLFCLKEKCVKYLQVAFLQIPFITDWIYGDNKLENSTSTSIPAVFSPHCFPLLQSRSG